MTKQPNSQQYQLTQAEQNALNKIAQLQRESVRTGKPRVLTIVITDGCNSFFYGDPAGVDKGIRNERAKRGR